MAFGTHVGDFGSLLGSLLETILVTFWGTIFASILRPPKNIEKERNPLEERYRRECRERKVKGLIDKTVLVWFM